MFKSFAIAAAIVALSATAAFAVEKSYQVTGPVVSMDDQRIVVQKGLEKWEIARGSAEVPKDVKVGSKVTVHYSMTASEVESKETKSKSASKSDSKEPGKLAPAAGDKKPSDKKPASY